MPAAMKMIFWVFLGLTFYTYAGYPVLLWLFSFILQKKVHKKDFLPRVSVILSAFNEEKYIERKIQNLLQLDYPEELLEIIIGSDGGSDTTDQIISKFKEHQIRFFRFVANQGKPQVINSLVREARGEILLFTDARQDFDPKAVKALVKNFSDPKVGCVSGELLFKDIRSGNIGKGMDAYWRYEKFLRKLESKIDSMLGATGAIYAIRKHLYTALPPQILADDMYLPLSIIAKGFRAVFEGDSIAYDHTSGKGKEEFKRKVRTLAGNYQIFQLLPSLMIPFKSPISVQLFSHKFLRLLIPFFQMLIFISSFLLIRETPYQIIFWMQVLFYALAYWESSRETLRVHSADRTHQSPRKKGLGYIPYTFCLLNYAAMIALFQFLSKKTKSNWEKAYG